MANGAGWRLGAFAGASLYALTLAASPAAAQDDGEAVESVVVTASRIQAAGFTAPTPTSVISTAELQKIAPIQISETLRTLVPSFRVSGATSTPNVYANLRSVGAQRTLVLVDGRRHVPTQPDGTLDLNVIPTALVQRAEVVTGGASASWGSDAVTGVVNLILNTRLEGLQGSLQGGISKYGDAENFAASLAGGRSFLGGKLHLVAGAEFSRDSGIDGLQNPEFARPWAFEERGSVGNSAFAANGLPGTIVTNNVRRADVGPGGLITSGPLRGLTFLPAGATGQFGFGQVFSNNMIGGRDNVGETIAPGGSLRFPFTRYTAMTHLEYEFSPRLTGFVEGTFASSLSKGETNPWRNQGSTTAATCTTTTMVSGIGAINVNINNPYLPAAVRAQMQQAGITCFSMGRSYRDIPALRTNDGSPYVWRGVAGLKGDLIAGWTWDAYYQYGKTRYQQRRENNLNLTNARWALDAVTNTAGQIVCRITLTNPNIPCAPMNPFGEGSISKASLDFVSGTTMLDQVFEQQVGAFNVHGSPLKLPAGEVAIAAGAEYRKESIDAVADPISEAGLWGTGNRKGAKGSYNVKEVYGEIVVPLLHDVPLIKAFDFNGAIRYTDYSSSGGVTTWKIGLTYDLTDEFRIRATKSRDIRAGNLSELFTASQTATVNARDPRTAGTITFVSDTRGNPDLAPEQADTVTMGAVYQPNWLSGFRVSVDYYRIIIRGVIGTPTAQNVLDLCYRDRLADYCNFVTLTTNNEVSRVVLTQLNLNKYVTGGVDIEASYRTPLARISPSLPGEVSGRVLASYVSRLATTAAIGATVTDPAGQYTTPKWTVFGQLSYTLNNFTATVEQQYYEGGTIDNTRIEGQVSLLGANINHVGSTMYTNLTLQYDLPANRLAKSTQLFLRVNNLFNTWPPWPNNGGGLFDEVGRAFRLGVRFKY
jgi:outer membrane receptor protein involved in Fe transport